jgi:hypothetical protein
MYFRIDTQMDQEGRNGPHGRDPLRFFGSGYFKGRMK